MLLSPSIEFELAIVRQAFQGDSRYFGAGGSQWSVSNGEASPVVRGV